MAVCADYLPGQNIALLCFDFIIEIPPGTSIKRCLFRRQLEYKFDCEFAENPMRFTNRSVFARSTHFVDFSNQFAYLISLSDFYLLSAAIN